LFVFFFSSRRRHTRFSRDWSSDVCSSDLEANKVLVTISLFFWCQRTVLTCGHLNASVSFNEIANRLNKRHSEFIDEYTNSILFKIGRASCRERVEIAECAVYSAAKTIHEY